MPRNKVLTVEAGRVRALLGAYRGDRLTADFDAVSVSVDGGTIRLTRREFELLRYLVQNKNGVVWPRP